MIRHPVETSRRSPTNQACTHDICIVNLTCLGCLVMEFIVILLCFRNSRYYFLKYKSTINAKYIWCICLKEYVFIANKVTKYNIHEYFHFKNTLTMEIPSVKVCVFSFQVIYQIKYLLWYINKFFS